MIRIADALKFSMGGHLELGELGIHCGKTTISNFKLLMHSNLV